MELGEARGGRFRCFCFHRGILILILILIWTWTCRRPIDCRHFSPSEYHLQDTRGDSEEKG